MRSPAPAIDRQARELGPGGRLQLARLFGQLPRPGGLRGHLQVLQPPHSGSEADPQLVHPAPMAAGCSSIVSW